MSLKIFFAQGAGARNVKHQHHITDLLECGLLEIVTEPAHADIVVVDNMHEYKPRHQTNDRRWFMYISREEVSVGGRTFVGSIQDVVFVIRSAVINPLPAP